MTQHSNEAFEKWMKKEVNTIEFDLWKNQYPDNTWQYADHSTNLAWIAWQAAEANSASNNLIERVITLLKESAWDDGIIDMRVDDLIEDVRALKGK
jgi:hypothetical protein